MVYQEQVMQIVHGLGGIPLRGAYTLIKAISKKKDTMIDAARAEVHARRCGAGASTRRPPNDLFDLILEVRRLRLQQEPLDAATRSSPTRPRT